MNLEEARQLLDKMAGLMSDYEFHSRLEMEGSDPRKLRRVLRDLESHTARMQELQLTMNLERYQNSLLSDPIEQSIKERLTDVRCIGMQREIQDLKAEIERCQAWLDQNNADTDIESGEREHWINVLGKRGAVEMLANGKINQDTMHELCMLPLEDFKASVRIMSRFELSINTLLAEIDRQA